MIKTLLPEAESIEKNTRAQVQQEIAEKLIPKLSQAAEAVTLDESSIIALDWMNGRRTPFANQLLKGALSGLNLASDAPKIFRALVEATAFGARKIVDRFQDEGIPINGVIALGGIPKKAPFIMQVLSDVLNMPIKVARSEQAVALGSAMAAATAAKIYPSIEEAQKAMGNGFETEYRPQPSRARKYQQLYEKYSQLGTFIENQMT